MTDIDELGDEMRVTEKDWYRECRKQDREFYADLRREIEREPKP